MIGLVAIIGVTAVGLPSTFATLREPSWSSAGQVPLLRSLILLEAVTQPLQLLAAGVGLVLIWQRHPATPRFFQVYLLAVCFYGILELAVIPQIYRGLAQLSRQQGLR